jgi:two-component system sensor histidine kinase SenX3
VLAVLIAWRQGKRQGRRALQQRLTALSNRLGAQPPEDNSGVEDVLSHLERITGEAAEAVTEASSDAIRLRRALDTLPQGVIVCDENGEVAFRNTRALALMSNRHGDALAAQAVTELLESAWQEGTAERSLDLFGPPRQTLTVRTRLIDDGRRPLGVIAIIEDVSERRRLEEIRRDFVANVSHELKTPVGALGLLAETLTHEPDREVAQRLAMRIHTEAFRVSRIIDDLLDLSRIESEEAPPREPVLVSLVMAEAVERVRSTAEQRGITINLQEPNPPVAVLGDRRQLVSAMHALLENAVTYSYDRSTVTVTGTLVLAEHRAQDPRPVSGTPATAPTATATTATSGASPLAAPVATAAAGPTDPTSPGAAGAQALPGATATDTAPPPGAGATNGDGAQNVPFDAAADEFDVGGGGGGFDEEDARVDDRDMVRISVTDQGVGIPARDLDRIFERFYRVDHGRSRETGGTGLGLSIVRHVASNHHGWVDVESREGEGSVFTLVLPIQPERLS